MHHGIGLEIAVIHLNHHPAGEDLAAQPRLLRGFGQRPPYQHLALAMDHAFASHCDRDAIDPLEPADRLLFCPGAIFLAGHAGDRLRKQKRCDRSSIALRGRNHVSRRTARRRDATGCG